MSSLLLREPSSGQVPNMPLVRIDLGNEASADLIRAVGDAVYAVPDQPMAWGSPRS
jgi:hypothetical protein